MRTFTPELWAKICEHIADGVSLRSIAKIPDMPGRQTIQDWMRKNPELREQYWVAKSEGADAMVEDMLDIADDVSEDFTVDEDGAPRVNQEAINRARLKVDTRKWIASKLRPHKYGDRVTLDGDPANPLKTVSEIIIRAVDAPKK